MTLKQKGKLEDLNFVSNELIKVLKYKVLIMLSKIDFKCIKSGSKPDAPEYEEGHEENT